MKDHFIIHRVNRDGMIHSVNDNWVRFALENGAPELRAENVVGRPLLDSIADTATRELYRKLLLSLQGKRTFFCFPLRCDSADSRRTFLMKVISLPGGMVEFRSKLILDVPRPRQLLFAPFIPRSEETVTFCSWCSRILVEGEWSEVEEALPREGPAPALVQPSFSHECCTECAASLVGRLRSLDAGIRAPGGVSDGAMHGRGYRPRR